MKYRRLSLEELEPLQTEFVQFLAVNGIDTAKWNEIKTDASSAGIMLDAFSDAWFEMYLQKIQFVEYHTPSQLLCFQFNQSSATLIHVELTENFKPQMNDEIPSSEIIQQITTELKPYQFGREKELFDFLEKGAIISNGNRFKSLALLFASISQQ